MVELALVGLTFAGLLALSGCTSPALTVHPSLGENKEDQNPIEQVLAHREPSSVVVRNLELEDILQANLANGHIKSHIQLKLEQIQHSYYVGLVAAREFDRMMLIDRESGITYEKFLEHLTKSGISPRLMAIKVFQDRAISQLNYSLIRLNEIMSDPNASRDKSNQAREAINFLETYLKQVTLSSRIALNRWAEKMYIALPKDTFLQGKLQSAYVRLCVGPARTKEIQTMLKYPEVLAHQKEMIESELNAPNEVLTDLTNTFARYQNEELHQRRNQSPSQVQPQNQNPNQRKQTGDLKSKASKKRFYAELTSEAFSEQRFAIVIEGGPHPIYSRSIINYFNSKRLPVAYFVSREPAQSNSIWLQELVGGGAFLGFMADSDRELPKMFSDEISNLVVLVQRSYGLNSGPENSDPNKLGSNNVGGGRSASSSAISTASKHSPGAVRLFIPPYHVLTPRVRELLRGEVQIVKPNIDSLNWIDRNTKQTVKRVYLQMSWAKKGIVVLEDSLANVAQIAEMIVSGEPIVEAGNTFGIPADFSLINIEEVQNALNH
jgi:hypothetical protein